MTYAADAAPTFYHGARTDLGDLLVPGNPIQSYRSQHPLRIVGEVTRWEGHAPSAHRN
jgi:hypothetical protein